MTEISPTKEDKMREANRARSAKWRRENPERFKMALRLWYLRNKARAKEAASKWIADCKLALKEWSKNKHQWQFLECDNNPL